MQKIQKILKNGRIHLALFHCDNADGRPQHAFVIINECELERIEALKGPVILGEYGKILYSNYGNEVSNGLIDSVTEGFKNHYLKRKDSSPLSYEQS